MKDCSLRITGTVVSVEVDPYRRDRLRRWLVTVRPEHVEQAELPRGSDLVTLLVHSPSRDCADADIVGVRYTITFLEPLDQPYMGSFEAERAAESHGRSDPTQPGTTATNDLG